MSKSLRISSPELSDPESPLVIHNENQQVVDFQSKQLIDRSVHTIDFANDIQLFRLDTALEHARNRKGEAPYCTPWDMACSSFLNIVLEKEHTTVMTVAYPQLPVTAAVDTYETETEELRRNLTRREQIVHGREEEDDDKPFPPPNSDPIHIIGTPLDYPGPRIESYTIEESINDLNKSTTCIPDFVLKVFEARRIRSGGRLASNVIRERTLLLIAVKAPVDDASLEWTVRNVGLQRIRVQAKHVFEENPDIRIVGCIVAVGERWNYLEYTRENVDGGDSDADAYDPALASTDSDSAAGDAQPDPVPQTVSDAYHSALKKELTDIFQSWNTVLMRSEEGEYTFSLVRRRLMEINPDYFA